MPDKGFAIRCPHCQRWNIWKDVVLDEKVIIATEDELVTILKELTTASERGEPDSFSHPKLWRCTNPRSLCPASFEAFICRTDADAIKFSEGIESWSLKRNFRLYKSDCETRWEGKYYGILFNTQPVVRLPHTELNLLMDRELVSRLIVGIGVEIEAPVTIYSANIFTPPKTKKPCVYWMPIEAYSQGRLLVPPLYNQFCHTCRQIVIQKLTDKFEKENYGVSNCPIGFAKDDLCAGKAPACMKKTETRDWNLCPAFVEERLKWDPCYQSDFRFINDIIKDLKDTLQFKGEFEEETLSFRTQRCHAQFHERAIPIVVHGYLVGVAMSGQVFFKPDDIVDVPAFCKNFPILSGSEQILQNAKNDLVANETEAKNQNQNKSRFFITSEQLDERVFLLADSIRRMRRTANSRYNDVRGRTEWLFRQEILGFIQNLKIKRVSPDLYLRRALDRMRLFWAFEAGYLTLFSPKTRCISVIGFAHKYRAPVFFGIPGKIIGHNINIAYDLIHPAPFLYIKGSPLPTDRNVLIAELLLIFERIVGDRDLELPTGNESFFAVIPFLGEAYAFAFPVRDEQIMGQIDHRVGGGVSRLCQDSILETCTDVIYEFTEERYRTVQAWRDFSAKASHRIGNEISSVGTLLDVLSEQLVKDPNYAQEWATKLSVMQDCIRASKKMLSDLTVLTASITPQPKLTNLMNLVKRAALGVLPTEANLNLQHLPPDIELLVDPELMEQTFRELCTNAARVTGKNLRLTVSARKEQDTLHILFKDNGPGIPDEQAKQVFEPFMTSEIGRSGQGLATIRHIIEAHGGSIRLQKSTVGAHFIILLPLERTKQK